MQPLFLREGISSGSFLAPRPPRNGSERDGGFPSDEASSGALVALVGQSPRFLPDSPPSEPTEFIETSTKQDMECVTAVCPRLSCKSN